MNANLNEQLDQEQRDGSLVITVIGGIDNSTGRNQYVHIGRSEGDLTPEQAQEWMLRRVYRDTNTPGGYFCHRVTCMQYPHADNVVICVIHHENDI